ncbi:MAG: sulfatase [Actinobacteria bacterium]|jgi:arylsulfatase A-like enzyme|nr:sulfatase [Actinomycetota bacterium]
MRRPARTIVTTVVSALTAVAIIAALFGAGLLAQGEHPLAGQSVTPDASSPGPLGEGPIPPPTPLISNVVLILADDLDWKLWNEIPRLRALQDRGTTFTNYVVSDSLCCPSRTTLFRSQYVHNHQVLSNDVVSGGGWPTFRDRGYATECLPTWLQDAGVTTGLIGKYLNEFPETPAEAISIQPGWDTFVVPISHGASYTGYNYQLDANGVIQTYGKEPQDFLNDVLDSKAAEFIAAADSPFFLELATFTPHLPSPVAPRNVGSHAGAQAPRDAAYGAQVENPPSWLVGLPPIGPKKAKELDRLWQQRAESAESIADSYDAVMSALVRSGHDKDTLVLVTSDNGFHVGSYRLQRGKRSAFDTDTVVPLVAIGPDIPAGKIVTQMASATDLAPTISELLAAPAPDWVDGRSLWPLLDSSIQFGESTAWRTATLSESLGEAQPGDPDFQLIAPPTYRALRTPQWLYVESVNGERELYDRRSDPYELRNVIATTRSDIVSALHEQFVALTTCAGSTCRVADAMELPQ